MKGRAHVEASEALLDLLRQPPLSRQVKILSVETTGDGYFQLYVESQYLQEGYNYQQEIFLVDGGDAVCFKPWRDV